VGGSFTPIDVPGAAGTFAQGINNFDAIVGGYTDAFAVGHGFFDSGGSFTPIDVPGAGFTNAWAINDSGDIVGEYTDATGTHGFLATPTAVVPEPASIVLLGSGLALIVACVVGPLRRAGVVR